MVVPSPFLQRQPRVDEKQHLRAKMRAARRDHVAALPQSTRALILMRPPAPVADLLPTGSTIGLYYATPVEAPTHGYARWLYENGRTIALPWFADRTAKMCFRIWHDPFDPDGLVDGPYGPQPANDSAEVVPIAVIVPLLAFTPDGARLGQGGGHYDRWLSNHPQTMPIGLGWDMQCLDTLPCESHDRKLAAVITPTRYYRSDD